MYVCAGVVHVLLFVIQRNSISPTEREKYRNARSPMGEHHQPDMKKIKREDKDGHVRAIYSMPPRKFVFDLFLLPFSAYICLIT